MRPNAYRNYLLLVLTVIFAFNYVDRLALGIVLQDIKIDLQLSDTELGLLSGLAFALFYSVLGIPIARWADLGNRVTIITVTTALWSAAVALSGVVTSFGQLLLVRTGVAVGEAGCVPPAHSLIASYFTRGERPRAVSLYMLGGPLAVVIGYFAGGWLNELYGWRMTFILLGLPGIVLAVLARSTLNEPRVAKGTTGAEETTTDAASEAEPRLREVCVTLATNPAFRHLLFCFSVWYFFGWGLQQWAPAFFIRTHGLATGELGTWFMMIYGVAGGVGIYFGGIWATRYAAGNEHLQLRACAIAFAFFALITATGILAPDYHLAFAAFALAQLGGSTSLGPIFATIQTLVPPRMRAMSIAIVYLSANLIGLGLGPLSAGMLSDALRPRFGEESLRYALLILCPGYFWAAWHLWRASRTVTRDLAATQFADPHGSARRALAVSE